MASRSARALVVLCSAATFRSAPSSRTFPNGSARPWQLHGTVWRSGFLAFSHGIRRRVPNENLVQLAAPCSSDEPVGDFDDAASSSAQTAHKRNTSQVGAPVACEGFVDLDAVAWVGQWAPVPAALLRLTRHGRAVYDGVYARLGLLAVELHHVFVQTVTPRGLDRPCSAPFMIKAESSDLCGLEPFSQKRLQCSLFEERDWHEDALRFHRLLLVETQRAFGVEFEFVVRSPPRKEGARPLSPLFCSGGDDDKEQAEDETAIPEEVRQCSISALARGALRDDLASWTWGWDCSVAPLEARHIEDSKRLFDWNLSNEAEGAPVEVRSPEPPEALSGEAGLRSVIGMLALLRHMGIQANPSTGMHIHVNIGNRLAAGERLSAQQVASVWVAYAQYQLAINEMLSPSRVGNRYAEQLFLSHSETWPDNRTDRFASVRAVFLGLHSVVEDVVRTGGPISWRALVDRVHREAANAFTPCPRRWQLNLVALEKYGTLEFRAHSATRDAERVLRWIRFLLAFVEHFGSGQGLAATQRFFDENADMDFVELRNAQRAATLEGLLAQLRGRLGGGDFADYYLERRWEHQSHACRSRAATLTMPDTRCSPVF